MSSKPSKTSAKEQYYAAEARQPATPFRMAYERSDLPVRIEHTFKGPAVRWTQDLTSLDYQQLLPLFCEGIRETKFPYDFIAVEGVHQLISGQPEKIAPVIPFMVQPLKAALRSSDPKIMISVLKILQKVAQDAPGGGEALVPYYRQLLPALGQYKTKNANLGDGVEYGQWKKENVADLIEETLQILEKYGGPNAFINIRYVIPLYESCVGNR